MRGQIYRHDGSRGPTWRFVVDLAPDPGTGRRRQRRGSGFWTRREAEAALNELLATSDVAPSGRAGRQTLREFLEAWLVANQPPNLSPTTWRGYAHISRSRVIPRIGAVRLDALTPTILSDLYADLREHGTGRNGGLSPQSVKNTYTLINRVLEDAVRFFSRAIEGDRAAGRCLEFQSSNASSNGRSRNGHSAVDWVDAQGAPACVDAVATRRWTFLG